MVKKANNARSVKAMVAAAVERSVIPKGATTNYLQRWCLPTVNVGSPIPANTGYGFSFQLSDLPNAAELTSTYDFFSIDRVDVELNLHDLPRNIATGLAAYPTVVLQPDYDDQAAPLTLDALLEYGKTVRMEKFSADRSVVKATLVPRLSNTLYRTGVSSAYSLANARTLVDCTNADAPHYGLKIWLNGYNQTQYTGGYVIMYVRYHLRLVATR